MGGSRCAVGGVEEVVALNPIAVCAQVHQVGATSSLGVPGIEQYPERFADGFGAGDLRAARRNEDQLVVGAIDEVQYRQLAVAGLAIRMRHFHAQLPCGLAASRAGRPARAPVSWKPARAHDIETADTRSKFLGELHPKAAPHLDE